MIFHRLASTTQTPEVALKQEQSREIWGKESRYGGPPAVKAYVGRLPPGLRGIEFDTDVPPEPGSPPGHAEWRRPRPGVVIEDGFAKLSVRWVRNLQK